MFAAVTANYSSWYYTILIFGLGFYESDALPTMLKRQVWFCF